MDKITEEKEMVKKMESFDKGTLRAMLYSIKDISLLQELIEIGDNFREATIVADKKR